MTEAGLTAEEREKKLAEFKQTLERYERKYGMSSDAFFEKWEKGEADWIADSEDWWKIYENFYNLRDYGFYVDDRDMTLEEFKQALERYERMYHMKSEEFYEKWEKGKTDFVAESVDWSTLSEVYATMNGKNEDSWGKLNDAQIVYHKQIIGQEIHLAV